jgi:hypothetical protein
MTVDWNSRRGLGRELSPASASDVPAGEEEDMTMAELLLAMRKAPETRTSAVARARRLLADPDYPPDHVMRKVAELLARRMNSPARDDSGSR